MMATCDLRLTNNPFTAAFVPLPGETEEECVKRVREEEEAVRISREIDEGLLGAEKLIERRRKGTKTLRLFRSSHASPKFTALKGQAESGKSTTLRSECRTAFVACYPPFS